MIEEALIGELSRQLDVWAAAYRNIDSLNTVSYTHLTLPTIYSV